MSSYSFRLADISDKELISNFMDENWGSKHPLIHNEILFEHYYISNDKLQFALCYKCDKLVSLCGYILCSHDKQPDIWISIWLALKGENGAGLELMAKLPELCGARIVSCNNIRPKTMPFYTFLGYTAARLPHFYRLSDKPEYSVCKISNKIILPVEHGDNLTAIINSDELKKHYTPCENRRPYKDLWYITRRYFDYPYQRYNVWRLNGETKTDAILITRTININGVNVLKIVDYTGVPASFARFGYGISQLQDNLNAEYIEMYCYGISSEVMQRAGFCEGVKDDKNIIPNYLTPPIYENTDYYFFTSFPDGFTMFKADGDQDRPNV